MKIGMKKRMEMGMKKRMKFGLAHGDVPFPLRHEGVSYVCD